MMDSRLQIPLFNDNNTALKFFYVSKVFFVFNDNNTALKFFYGSKVFSV